MALTSAHIACMCRLYIRECKAQVNCCSDCFSLGEYSKLSVTIDSIDSEQCILSSFAMPAD